MSLARFAKRRDAAEKSIVDALEAISYTVIRLDQPVDLLLISPQRAVSLMEVGDWILHDGHKVKKRRDQPEQDDFRITHNVPIVKDVDEALTAVGVKI